MDKTWKSVERRVAAFFGGDRVPVSGRMRGFAPDVLHPTLSIEVKHREELPGWLLEAMEQAEASKRGDQIPMAILHEKGMSISESLTVFRASSILALLTKIDELENELEDKKSMLRYYDDLGGG